MKNRFYDAEMHTVNWASMRTLYEPLLDFVVDQEELQSVMMMMIGELNASHTGVSGGPSDAGPSTGQTRQPGFTYQQRSVRLLPRRPHLSRRARPITTT